MPKTTTTPTTAERARQTREHLSAAKEALAVALATQEEAQTLPDVLLARRAAGDLTVTTPDLVAARAAYDLAVADVTYAQTQVTKAERALVNDEHHLADAVGAALAKVLRGFTIVTTTTTHETPASVTVPEVYLEQTKASTPDLISGRISGVVDLFLVRPVWARPLDVEEVDAALLAAQVYSDVTPLGSRTSSPDFAEDHIRVTVRAAWASSVLPTIRKVNGESMFPQVLAGGYAKEMQQGTLYVERSSDSSRVGYSIDAVAECNSMDETTTTHGVRRTTVRATLIAGSRDPNMSANKMAGGLKEYAASQVKGYAQGLGQIESIRLIPAVASSATVRGRGASGAVQQAWTIEAVFLSLPTA